MTKIIELETINRRGPFWIDECDADYVRAAWGWRFNGHHIDGPSDGTTRLLHRQLLTVPEGMVTDHRDGNGRNCTRANLRVCTQRQNMWNSGKRQQEWIQRSRFVGVYPNKARDLSLPWLARIFDSRRRAIPLGAYPSEIEAAHAYDKECLKCRGEFAWLNFPPLGWVQSGHPAPGPWDEWLASESRRKAKLLGTDTHGIERDL